MALTDWIPGQKIVKDDRYVTGNWLLVFAVYDLKARAYMPPFTCPTAGVAIRGFAGAVRGANSPFHEFPADYALHQIGEFNDGTGELKSPVAPIPLAMATEFVQHVPVASPATGVPNG